MPAKKENEETTLIPKSLVDLVRYRSNASKLKNKITIEGRTNSFKLFDKTNTYKNFLEDLGLIFLKVSVEGQIFYLTDLTGHQIALSANDLVKNPKSIYSILHRDDIEVFKQLENARKNSLKDFIEVEYRIKKVDGSYKWVYQRQGPELRSNGNVKYYNSLIMDINEKKTLEHQLALSNRIESVGLLASGIAHDFKNNLSAILGQIHLALGKLSTNDEAYQALIIAESATMRSAEMTKKLVNLACNSDVTELESINLSQLIKETKELLQPIISNDIEIVFNSSINSPTVYGNYTQLQQVLINIIINAKEAILDSGQISINLERLVFNPNSFNSLYPDIKEGKYINLEIKDSGKGIPEDYLDYIFDPFFTTKNKESSTGLGLNMSYKIIKSFKGFLRAYNSKDAGAVFSILLPESEKIIKKINYEDIKSIEPIKTKQNILIADDNEIILSLLNTILSAAGYNVTVATDGKEAIELYKKSFSDFDCVILDESMPELTGRQVLSEIYKINPKQRVIVATGITGLNCYKPIATGKNFEILEKPFHPKVLLEKLAL